MKKLLAMLLALAMVFALAACGDTQNDDPAEDQSPSVSDEGGESGDVGETGPVYDTVNISVTVSNNEQETGGMLVTYFINYIEEHSNGAITFTPYYGGTVFDSSEILTSVGTGAVDMTMTGTSQFSAELPLINFPSFVYGTQADALAYAEYIAFENEETSAAIAAELAEYNLVTIGLNAGGGNAYFFKNNYASLTEATSASLLLGCGSNLGCYEALGFNTTSTMPWDVYDQLSKGVIDCTQMAIGPAVSMNWYEAAPYMMVNNQYAFGNWWLINQDVWNSLSADTQELFYEAAAATQDYSIELYSTEIDDASKVFEGVSYLTDDEQTAEMQIFFEQSYADCRAAAANADKSAEMETILAATNAYLGLEIE